MERRRNGAAGDDRGNVRNAHVREVMSNARVCQRDARIARVFGCLLPSMADVPAESSPLRRQPRQARSQERVRRILEAAEALVLEGGVGATTTNAIAARAGVPIGSLYQFFPDKAAILRSLAHGYGERLEEQLTAFDRGEGRELSLEDYIAGLVDLTDRFIRDNPGYPAIFMDVQAVTADLRAIEEEADSRLIAELSRALLTRAAAAGCGIGEEDSRLIAWVLVKTIGNLLWLGAALEPPLRIRLMQETRELAIAYLRRRIREA